MATFQVPPAPPRAFRLGEFNFSVLSPDCAVEDFAAVTSSEAHLLGLFGSDWPKGMTWERNYADLQRHADEFDNEVAFAWVIRNATGGYLGCVYLRPNDQTRAAGEVYLWLQASETSLARVSDLVARLTTWMEGLGYDRLKYPFITP